MKKVIRNLTISLTAAAVMSACADDKTIDVLPDGGKVPLKFTIAGVEALKTRATPILGEQFPTNESFTIWGFNKANEGDTEYDMFLDNIIAYVNDYGDISLYDGPHYWPETASSAFLCLYTPPRPGAVNFPSADFLQPYYNPQMRIYYKADSFDGAHDVLVAAVKDPTPGQPIELVFRHLLARITFQCRLVNNSSNSSVKFKSITLRNVYTVGEFNFNSEYGLLARINNELHDQERKDITAQLDDYMAKELRDASNDLVDLPGAGVSGDGYSNVFAYGYKNNSFLVIPHTPYDLQSVGLDMVITIDGKDVAFNIDDLSRFWPNRGGDIFWMSGRHINYRLMLDVDRAKPIINVSSVMVEEWLLPENVDVDINIQSIN